MWGAGIVGFGTYHYKYESGHEGDAPLVGLASRVNGIVLYLSSNFNEKNQRLKKIWQAQNRKRMYLYRKA
jgi:hypothetical protein